MFKNIGGKIKFLAVCACACGIVFSIIYGIYIMKMFRDSHEFGLLIIIFGSLLSWLGSFVLYGFGQLVENSDTSVEMLKNIGIIIKGTSNDDNNKCFSDTEKKTSAHYEECLVKLKKLYDAGGVDSDEYEKIKASLLKKLSGEE